MYTFGSMGRQNNQTQHQFQGRHNNMAPNQLQGMPNNHILIDNNEMVGNTFQLLGAKRIP